MNEQWGDVLGYEKVYDISTTGRVKRVGVGGHGTYPGKLLKNHPDSRGYMCVRLCKDGIAKTHRIHRLMLTTFIRPIKSNEDGHHVDGNKLNNNLKNLKIIDHISHMLLSNRGCTNGRSKLTEENVLNIRRRSIAGESRKSIANKYSVTIVTIHNIITRKQWKHI